MNGQLLRTALITLLMIALASCGGGGDEEVDSEPTVVEPPAGIFTALSAGGDHTCGILDTGAVTCWGLDEHGQSTPPTGTFTALSAGGDHTCGILDAGTVACWGLDGDGQSTPLDRTAKTDLVIYSGFRSCVWSATASYKRG